MELKGHSAIESKIQDIKECELRSRMGIEDPTVTAEGKWSTHCQLL